MKHIKSVYLLFQARALSSFTIVLGRCWLSVSGGDIEIDVQTLLWTIMAYPGLRRCKWTRTNRGSGLVVSSVGRFWCARFGLMIVCHK